ncbi:RNA polymerase I-specific transcription initiation factor Rrn7p [[Candida] jaroonii]|uniref:RNA polymerase I-specific transcription initiation factor Rrn7p n=1 Tax=[Candida] jaroonii TaxID=467808 RepID=A0ACA9YBD5_9ASCO|nr:RNA polymerase I-specific transcription initiation factor Rrn7p [[Candida] jaroonii]
MSQSYIKGPVCGTNNCPSRLYRVVDGLKICQFGHVLEGDIQINDDEDGEVVVTKKLDLRISETGELVAKRKKREKAHVARLTGNIGKEFYLKILQKILQSQLQSVILFLNEEFQTSDDFTNTLKTVVKLNWIKLLEFHLSEDSMGDGENFQIKSNTKLPNINDTILTIYYSIVQLNYVPLYFDDLIEMIGTNVLPSHDTYHLLTPEELARIPFDYYTNIKFAGLSEAWIISHYLKFASKISLSRPKYNYYIPFLLKTTMSLLLPNSIEIFVLTNSLVSKMDFTLEFPELMLVSSVIFMIKIYFIYLSPQINYQTWLNNLKTKTFESNEVYQFMNKTNYEDINQLVRYDDKKIQSYLEYLNKKVFTKNLGSSIMQDRLKLIFNLDDVDDNDFNDIDIDNDNENNDKDREYLDYFKNPPKITQRDIFVIEDFLFGHFSSRFFVSKSFIYKKYLEVEEAVKHINR